MSEHLSSFILCDGIGRFSRLLIQEEVELGPLRAELAAVRRQFEQNAPWQPQLQEEEELVPAWVDASTQAIAAVIEREVDQVETREVYHPATQIYLAELRAALLGLSLARPNERFHVITDNTAVLHSVRKGHSLCDQANAILREIMDSNALAAISWVDTKVQRADGPTRNRAPGPRVVIPCPSRARFMKPPRA